AMGFMESQLHLAIQAKRGVGVNSMTKSSVATTQTSNSCNSRSRPPRRKLIAPPSNSSNAELGRPRTNRRAPINRILSVGWISFAESEKGTENESHDCKPRPG